MGKDLHFFFFFFFFFSRCSTCAETIWLMRDGGRCVCVWGRGGGGGGGGGSKE